MAVPIVKMKVGAVARQEEHQRTFRWPGQMMKAESPHLRQVWDSLERAEAKVGRERVGKIYQIPSHTRKICKVIWVLVTHFIMYVIVG